MKGNGPTKGQKARTVVVLERERAAPFLSSSPALPGRRVKGS